MLDQRTSAFLEEFLAKPGGDPERLDRFLLHGPYRGRRGGRPRLKLAFHDFWPEFDTGTNFFIEILSSRFDLSVVEDDSDLAIVSVFGGRHRAARSRRTLFFTGENVRPPLDGFDMAVSFDRVGDPRHYRLPLYVMHAYEHMREGAVPHFCSPVLPPVPPSRAAFAERNFCAFLYKNPNGERRNRFFPALDARRRVDSVGWHLNNTGSVVKMGWLAKIRVFERYRFAFAFENASHPGYLTEKILDVFQAGAVPLYWGDPDVEREVAAGSFIDVSRFAMDEEAAEHILALDGDYDAYCAYRTVAPFLGTEEFHFDAYRLADWIESRL
ncbi:glycosyltransferase family 10 domain-containing protein [Azospirillum aestuarii]|uniref:glycosyltransferase family 10 domain-containing protein n=1 Tax=Azospirillum aestuarii TaxID=2802052 RepID=UPI0040551B63